MSGSGADVASSMQVSCSVPSWLLYVALTLAGLVVTFTGYRLYRSCIRLLGFILFFAIEGAIGMSWTEQAKGSAIEKKVIVLCFCVMWGSIGAFIFGRFVHRFQKVVGFIMGAILGFVLLVALINALKSTVDSELGPDYSGWDAFVAVSLGLPVAIFFGYLLKDSLKYAIMLVTAAGGAVYVVWPVMAMVQCTDSEKVLEPTMQSVLMLVLAVVGFVVQFLTDPERGSIFPK